MGLMIDVADTCLSDEDKAILANPNVVGLILFAKNLQDPAQVRSLSDSVRVINPNIVIGIDQEGGRVARLRDGFTKLPAMGAIGKVYDTDPAFAKRLGQAVGYVLACEVLAVGVDMSFAPVLDIDNGSLVIGDRAFHRLPNVCIALSDAVIDGMTKAGMATTGKHFPGHGTAVNDSHINDACDNRSFDEIWASDLSVFVANLSQLSALMPAHVVFSQIDDKPAGFSRVWLQDIIRHKLGFDGVLFSDDLSMKAAQIAGDMPKRVQLALTAGCDVALICNDRQGVIQTLACMDTIPQTGRLAIVKANLPSWQGSLLATCEQGFGDYTAMRQIVTAFMSNG